MQKMLMEVQLSCCYHGQWYAAFPETKEKNGRCYCTPGGYTAFPETKEKRVDITTVNVGFFFLSCAWNNGKREWTYPLSQWACTALPRPHQLHLSVGHFAPTGKEGTKMAVLPLCLFFHPKPCPTAMAWLIQNKSPVHIHMAPVRMPYP